jgi:recombination protein RecA
MAKKTAKDKMVDGNQQKSIDAAIAQIEKAHGKGSIMRMTEENRVVCDVVSTGSIALDVAIGIGGLPLGRVVEIYGPESSGKTTIALQTIAEAQKDGYVCAFIDAEHALDPIYAEQLGVDMDALYVSQPDHGEQALEIADTLARSEAFNVICIDSVAALTPKVELEGEMTDANVGLQARMMSKALRKLTGTLKQNNVMCIFINQIRMKIGVMFGSPETTTGGNALKFYASVRLDIRRTGSIKEGDEIVGNETKVKVVKNKMAPPFKLALTQIMFGTGTDLKGELLDIGVEKGIVEKSGSWYSYNGERIGQGKNKCKLELANNEELFNNIYKQVHNELFGIDLEEIEEK